MPESDLNDQVRAYWELEPCGTSPRITGSSPRLSREWFERVEAHRYDYEPMIHTWAQFTRHHGKRLLEVGVGAGTDHLQWARAGLECHGVDLTDAAIDTTRARLETYGFKSELQRIDAETLPFADALFDVVYSWGVIHHAEKPQAIIHEIRRVLKPGGLFIGMMYGRNSVAVFKQWIKHALLKGRPWMSFSDVLWRNVESVGTKAYTARELRDLFSAYTAVETRPFITHSDTGRLPACVAKFLPADWGWFIAIRAVK